MTDRRFMRRVSLLVLPALLLVSSQPARAADPALPPEIEKLLALPEDKIDIGLAALTFAHDVAPEATDIQAYSKRIDQLAAEVRNLQLAARAQKIPGLIAGPDDTILALNSVFFNREGFHYDHSPDALNNMQNYFLPGTLEKKQGICSTLPMLYMAVAQRLGLPVYAVDAPAHNFLRIVDPRSQAPNIEVTSGGGSPSDDWYIKRQNITAAAIKHGTYMRTMTHHQYLAVLLNISAGYYHHDGDDDKAIKYFTRAMEIYPQSPAAPVGLMAIYLRKSQRAEDDFIYAPQNGKDLKRLAGEYLDKALYYRNKVAEMGVTLDDYVIKENAKTQ